MSFFDKASDWKVAGLASISAGLGPGGGAWWFEFKSEAANVREVFMFIGGGPAAGFGSGGGASIPDLARGNAKPSYSAIQCDRPFSVSDLDMSFGSLLGAGASIVLGYGLVFISATSFSGSMFKDQWAGGGSVGVGASAVMTMGYWRSATIAGRDANRAARGYFARSAS